MSPASLEKRRHWPVFSRQERKKVTAGEMAGGAIVPSDGPATDYGGSLTLLVFMSCLVAASGGLIFGYDIGISGPVFKTKLLYFSCSEL